MPLYTSDALILRTYKLGEADRIVVFLTRDRGKKRGVAKGARRHRSRFGGTLEPLTDARVAYFEHERRELVGLNYVEAARSPLAAADGESLAYVGYFAELLDEWAPEASPDERLYRLGASVVDALARGVAIEPLARYFEYWLLRLQGVYPPHVVCTRCGAELLSDEPDGQAVVMPREGALSCGACARAHHARGRSLSRGALGFLNQARRATPLEMDDMPIARVVVRELETVHRMLIATHLEKELKSIRVLREMRR